MGTREEHRFSSAQLPAPSPALPVGIGTAQTQTGLPLGLCFGIAAELAADMGGPYWSQGSTALQKNVFGGREEQAHFSLIVWFLMPIFVLNSANWCA